MLENNNYSSRRFKFLKGLLAITLVLAFIAAFSWIVMLLWNAILPDVTGVKPLNFWQAAGLLLLAKILFGGFGGGRGWKRRQHWKKKWMGMNTEERQEAKSRWKEYCNRKKSDN